MMSSSSFIPFFFTSDLYMFMFSVLGHPLLIIFSVLSSVDDNFSPFHLRCPFMFVIYVSIYSMFCYFFSCPSVSPFSNNAPSFNRNAPKRMGIPRKWWKSRQLTMRSFRRPSTDVSGDIMYWHRYITALDDIAVQTVKHTCNMLLPICKIYINLYISGPN